ncbi:MAG: hypothetical protein H5T33_05455 [Candidatus Methanosuratus sp.]|nr:hypothetical protein [Candidatus Methanosuratincola sp.]
MEKIRLKIDSKGRICIPQDLREEIDNRGPHENSLRIPHSPWRQGGRASSTTYLTDL